MSYEKIIIYLYKNYKFINIKNTHYSAKYYTELRFVCVIYNNGSKSKGSN